MAIASRNRLTLKIYSLVLPSFRTRFRNCFTVYGLVCDCLLACVFVLLSVACYCICLVVCVCCVLVFIVSTVFCAAGVETDCTNTLGIISPSLSVYMHTSIDGCARIHSVTSYATVCIYVQLSSVHSILVHSSHC